MSALLPSERGTWKGRLFLGCVYALLTLGGITMVRLNNEMKAIGRKLDWKLHKSDFQK